VVRWRYYFCHFPPLATLDYKAATSGIRACCPCRSFSMAQEPAIDKDYCTRFFIASRKRLELSLVQYFSLSSLILYRPELSNPLEVTPPICEQP
jgi:hypothetical protein